MLLTYTITSITNEVELLRCDFFFVALLSWMLVYGLGNLLF